MLALVVAAVATLHITDEAHVVQMYFVGTRGGTVDCDRHGDAYACGEKSVPVAAVDALRAALVVSEKHQAFDPRAFGITPEWVRSVRPQLIEQGRRDWNRFTGGHEDPWPNDVLNAEAERAVSFEAVAADAKAFIDGGPRIDHYTTPEIVVRLDGLQGFEVSSKNMHARMTPWTVKLDGRTLNTYSFDVSVAVAAVAGSDQNRRFLDANSYVWPDTFLREQLWGHKIARAAEADQGVNKARGLPGATLMLERFDIARATLSRGRWWVTLRPKHRETYDEVEWGMAASAATSWEPLLRRLDEVERFLSGAKWMAAASKGRHVHLRFATVRPLQYARWGKATLMGTPDVELKIEGTDDSRATILVGIAAPHVVVESLRHMPEIDGHDFGPGVEATYLVGAADGRWERVSW